MAIALVTNAAASGSPATTTGVDTTGSNLLVAVCSYLAAATGVTLTDSKSNTWTAATAYSGSTGRVRIYYSVPSSVGSSHTVTLAGTSLFGSVCFAAFSGAASSSPADQENGATTASSTTLQPGSVTPSENNELLVSGLNFQAAGTMSINSSFSITNQQNAGSNFGGALAYLIQTSASAVNPTWSRSGASQMTATILTFKAAAGGGGSIIPFVQHLNRMRRAG